MLLFVIKVSIFSIIFIYLVHYLLNFFKDNLTVPKTKNIFETTPKKYQEIINTLTSSSRQQQTTNTTTINVETGGIMKEELKNFLKMQLEGEGNDDDDEMTNDNNNFIQSYSFQK